MNGSFLGLYPSLFFVFSTQMDYNDSNNSSNDSCHWNCDDY